jgi:LysM repeat protein
MVSFAKQYCPLWTGLLFLLIFDMAALATDKEPSGATNDILRRLGHEPIPTQTNQSKNIIADKNGSSSEKDFESPVTEFHTHTVKAGESLSMISKFYYDDYGKISLIAEHNHIKDINQLRVGQKIKIPIIELKQLEKVTGFQEKNLAESREIKKSFIEESDLKKKGVMPKDDYLPIAIFIIIYFLMILFFLFIKLSGMQVTTKGNERIEKASFVLGKVENSELNK